MHGVRRPLFTAQANIARETIIDSVIKKLRMEPYFMHEQRADEEDPFLVFTAGLFGYMKADGKQPSVQLLLVNETTAAIKKVCSFCYGRVSSTCMSALLHCHAVYGITYLPLLQLRTPTPNCSHAAAPR